MATIVFVVAPVVPGADVRHGRIRQREGGVQADRVLVHLQRELGVLAAQPTAVVAGAQEEIVGLRVDAQALPGTPQASLEDVGGADLLPNLRGADGPIAEGEDGRTREGLQAIEHGFRIAGEGMDPARHLIEQRTQREDVGARVGELAASLLW